MKLFCFFSVLVLNTVSLADSSNVLLLIVDDLRPVLGCYGDKIVQTPNIDALASSQAGFKTAIFHKAYAQQALCAPSRNSFLTSRRPDTTHLYDFYSYWRDKAGNFTTLPQFFKSQGYFTHSIGKVFHPGISSNKSDDQPYSWSTTPFHPSTEIYKNAAVCKSSDGKRHKNLLCPVKLGEQPEGTLPDIQSAEEAVKFLRFYNKSAPFFLAVGFHKPHVPFKFPDEYLDSYPINTIPPPKNPRKTQGLPDVAWNSWTSLRVRDDIGRLNLSFPYGPVPDDYVKKIRQHYFAAVSYTDDQIGKILDGLKGSAWNSDTIIALIGDHGWSLGENQEWAKFSNFETALRVPFIIRTPQNGIDHSKVEHISQPVELLDLFPTLAELANLPKIPKCPRESAKIDLCTEGKSRAALLAKSEPKRHHGRTFDFAFSQYPRPTLHPIWISDKPRLKSIKYMGYSVRSERYRLTEWFSFNASTFSPDLNNAVGAELYDHETDLKENLNLIDCKDYKRVAHDLKKILHDHIRERDFPIPHI